MPDNVKGVIDPSVPVEIQASIDLLELMDKEIVQIAKDAKTIEINIKGIDTLSQVTGVLDRVNTTLADLATLQQNVAQTNALVTNSLTSFSSSANNGTNATTQLNSALQDNVKALLAARAQMQDWQNKIAMADEALGRGGISVKRYNEILQESAEGVLRAKNSVDTFTLAINSEFNAINLADASFQKLNATMAVHNVQVKDAEKNNKLNAQALVAEEGSVDALTIRLKLLNAEWNAMAPAARAGTDGQLIAGNIKNTSAELKKLGVETQNVAGVNDRLTASFERVGIRMIASFVLYQTISSVFEKISTQIGDSIDRIRYKQIAASAVAKEMANSFTEEAVKLRAMQDRWDAVGTSMESKKQIVIELNDAVKDQYKAINSVSDAEDFFKNKSKDFIIALQIRAEAQANLTALTKEYEKQIELNADPQAMLDKWDKFTVGLIAAGGTLKKLGKKGGGEGADIFPNEYDWDKTVLGVNKVDMALHDSYNKQSQYLKNIIDLQNKAAGIDTKNGFDTTDTKNQKKDKSGTTTEKKSNDDLARAIYNYNRQKITDEANTNKAIYESDDYTLEQRAEAYRKYYQYINDLAQQRLEFENKLADDKISANNKRLAKGGLTPEETTDLHRSNTAQGIQKQANQAEYTKTTNAADATVPDNMQGILNSDSKKRLGEIQKSGVEEEIELTNQYGMELAQLKMSLDKKKITREQYNTKIDEAQTEFNEILLGLQIAQDNRELKQLEDSGEEKTEKYLQILKDRHSKSTQLSELQNGSKKKKKDGAFDDDPIGSVYNDFFKSIGTDPDVAQAAAKKASELTIQLAQETADAVKTIKDNAFEQTQRNLAKQEQTIERNSQNEINATLATTGYAITKSNQITQINAQTQAQEAEIEQKKQQTAIKQAKFDKAANMAGIIAAGAMGVAKIWSQYAGAPYVAAALTALEVGIIGAQLAKAASAPLPQYRYGTKEGGHPHDGLAIVGDGGQKELISNPDGSSYWSGDSAEVRYLAKGTVVTPRSELMEYSMNRASRMEVGADGRLKETANNSMIQLNADLQEVKKAIKEQTHILATVIGATGRPQSTDSGIKTAKELRKLKYLQ